MNPVLEQVRCPNCNRLLGNLNGQAEIKCPKCKSMIFVDTEKRKIFVKAFKEERR